MRKYFLLLNIITLGLFNHASFSQDVNMLKNAPFIFKGTVVSFKAFKAKNDNTLYASYIVNITAIYKGENELKIGTVEMITEAPHGINKWGIMDDGGLVMGNDEVDFAPEDHSDHSKLYTLEFRGGETGIFFCNKNKVFSSHVKSDNIERNTSYVLGFTYVKTDNVAILEPICNTSDCFFYYYNGVRRIENSNRTEGFLRIKGFGKGFNSEEELMEYLKKESIISQNDNNKDTEIIEKTPLKQTQAQKAEADSIKQVQNKLLYEQRKKNNEQYMEQRMKIKEAQQKKKDKK
ncbi:MAG: hypothetical protein A2X08_06615 [Bacteroidetes bacterium GWA2_32_17]|nr:MAG: hypothetical protein A2X08_06615 [Bacteroidetes bacterium GWA2_32_17]